MRQPPKMLMRFLGVDMFRRATLIFVALWLACRNGVYENAREVFEPSEVGDAECGPEAGQREEVAAPASCAPNLADFPKRPKPPIAPTLPFLRVEGTEIVDEQGNSVALRGVNFGSWLLVENWIAGIGPTTEGALLEGLDKKAMELGVYDLLEKARAETALEWVLGTEAHRVLIERWRESMLAEADDRVEAVKALWAWFDEQPWYFEERSLWQWLEKRFGYERARELRKTFQQNFITEYDVEMVASLGLNVIRVPIFYLNVETDVEGENRFEEEGFQMLDRLALWARKHKVYLILDMHGAPGGQNAEWHSGLPDGGKLWTRPECVEKTARLWQAIASYFADDPHIAAYDLLNEPMTVETSEQYREVHDRIYRAIREVDKRHIIIIEDGYKAPSILVSPKEMGWEDAMFSVHLYVDPPKKPGDYMKALDRELKSAEAYYQYSKRFDCPLLLGEFNPETDVAMGIPALDAALAMLNQRGVHWTLWTWKYAWPGSMWGVITRPSEAARTIDVEHGSFEEIKAEFESLNSINFELNTQYASVLKARATERVMPLGLGEIHERRLVEQWTSALVRVGVGKRVITPDFEPYKNLNPETNLIWDVGEPFEDKNGNGKLDTVWLGGMGPRQPTGVLDDLWARAVAFAFDDKAFVLISLDVLGVSMRRADAIRRKIVKDAPKGLSVRPEYIVVAATHTHSGPDTIGIFGPDNLTPAWNAEYLDMMEAGAVAAGLEALSSLRPATLWFAEGYCGSQCVVDTDPPYVIDPYIAVLQARSLPGDEVIATLVSVANHPEALWGGNTLISSDFPHVLRQRLEDALGGMAVYFSADEGLMQTPAKDVPEGPARQQHIGVLYAEAVLQALKDAKNVDAGSKIGFGFATVPTRLDNVALFLAVQMEIAEGYKEYLYSIEDDALCYGFGCIDLPILVLKLGDVATLVTFPGEVVPELVTGEIQTPWELGSALVFPEAEHEPALTQMLATQGRFIVGLANAEVGYIFPKCTYAPAAIFGQQHAGGPDVAFGLMNALRALLERVNGI